MGRQKEPDHSAGYVPDAPAMTHYVKMFREIREALDKVRIDRNRMGLVGLDCGNPEKFTSPEGVASLDATITVAEGIIRAINTGITSFCIWSLMNPNTVNGHWAVMGENEGELIRYKYPFAVYGLMANHIPDSAIVYPL